MRMRQIGLLVVATAGFACRSPSVVPEEGAALLRLSSTVGSPAPDELRVWAYHDGGRLWDGARIPEKGTLASKNPAELGTILIAPGAIQGALRIHIRALAAGERLADGLLTVPSLTSGDRTYDLRLEPAVPADSDGDGVPDAIDDCASLANPSQGGCSTAPRPDTGADGAIGAPTRDDAGANPVDAGNSGRDSGRESPTIDAEQGLGPDTRTVAVTDTETGGPGDAPIDWPTIVIPDADVKSGIEVGRQDSGSDPAADTRVNLGDLSEPVDISAAADGAAANDSVPTFPEVSRADTPEEDVCGINCKKSQGELCAQDDECASGFCADGVCCTNSCAGPCRSCNQPDSTGICRGYTAGTDPEGECTEGAKCNGVGACGVAPPPGKANGQLCGVGDECLSGVCKDGVCCNEACDQPCQSCGTGTCQSVKKADDIPECTGSMTCNPTSKCVAK